jgi:hypothetical protein
MAPFTASGILFCSQAFLDGAAEADIKDWLGHRDSRMVTHYRHLRREDSVRKIEQIDFLGDRSPHGAATVPGVTTSEGGAGRGQGRRMSTTKG